MKGKFVSKNKKNAFTILEALMGLMVMGVIAVLILQMVLIIANTTSDQFNHRQSILFITQFQRDLLATEHITIESENVRLEKHNEEVVYYGLRVNKIIRAHSNSLLGGEVVLTNIEELKFMIDEDVLSALLRYANDKNEIKITLGTAKFE